MKTVLTTLGISLLVLAGCAGQKQAETDEDSALRMLEV